MRNLLHSNVWHIVDCLNEQHFSITWVVHAWTNDNSQAIALSVSDSYTISLPCIPWMLLNCNRKIVEILPDNKLDLKTVLLFYSYFECDEILRNIYIYIQYGERICHRPTWGCCSLQPVQTAECIEYWKRNKKKWLDTTVIIIQFVAITEILFLFIFLTIRDERANVMHAFRQG